MMLYRKNDAVLDFDLAKVVEHTRDNPVFYVQYAHARCQSVFRNARDVVPELPQDAAARSRWLVEAAAAAHESHRIAFYLYELASEFHALWNKGNELPHLRFIIHNDPMMTVARLALVEGVVTVLASGLALLGVEAPDEM